MSAVSNFLPHVPHIPVDEDELRSALQAAAVPGFTGDVLVEIVLMPEIAHNVKFLVSRRQCFQAKTQQQVHEQVTPDPSRRKPVENVITQVRDKLYIRPGIYAVEAHFKDGVVTAFHVRE